MSDDRDNEAPAPPSSLLGILQHVAGVKRGRGRPTDYDPSMCQEVIDLGRRGKSHAQIAADMGVSRSSLYLWAEQYPQFSDAMDEAYALSQAWWENAGQMGMLMPGFNASVYNKQMANRFRKEHGDVSKVEHSGPNGGPIPTTIQIVGVEPGKTE